MALLEIQGLSVHYGSIHALHGVSLSIEEGRIVSLLGANGAGKSTTLRAVTGIQRSTGKILFEGQPILGLPAHEIVRRGISHVPEGRGIFANLTVDENLDLGAYTRTDAAKVKEERERLFGIFPRLKERLRQKAGTLSGGEQQMLAIARALLSRPRLLLLDEPSLGMAPQLVLKIFEIIREINALGTTILLVEQNAYMALKIAHYAYVLEVGRIAAEGPAAELAGRDEIKKIYLGAK
jgi:branched-chain amino acid transport system ATP-binding protein